MARMLYTDGFIEDLSFVYSDEVQDNIRKALNAIEVFPKIGSNDIPRSVADNYGSTVLKIAVNPFDLIYEYDESADTVILYALVPFKRAH